MGQLRDGVHVLEDGHVVCSGGVVHVRVNGSSCYARMRHVGLCGGERDRVTLVGLVDHYAGVTDFYADELHLAPDNNHIN